MEQHVPKLATYAVEYWTCGDPSHRHIKREVALRCCRRCAGIGSGSTHAKLGKYKTAIERNRAIAVEFCAGRSVKEIALAFGLSGTTVRNAIYRTYRRARHMLGHDWIHSNYDNETIIKTITQWTKDHDK